MPFLTRADRIVVASVCEAEGQDSTSAQTLAEQLRWHRLDAEARYVAPNRGSAPQALVQLARELEAELIVMGGYGHSRVREFMFGGFTRYVLEESDLSVLMVH
jgi:nucleotide-binding universal stress UspA family protein